MVCQAINTSFSPENMAILLESSRAPQRILPESPKDSSGAIDDAVSAEVVDIIQYHSQGKHPSPLVSSDSQQETNFTSISVPFSSKVSTKLKAKFFTNQYLYFGALLSSFLPGNQLETVFSTKVAL